MTASAGPSAAHARITLATAERVLRQLVRDRRTVALLLGAPTALTGLLAWIVGPEVFDQWGGIILGIFPLITMFLVTSVGTLRERTSGTLERLMTLPLAKADFLVGYGLAFGVAAVVQALFVSAFTFGPFGLDVPGPAWAFVLVAVANALLGTSLGLFASAFARTEFQAVQLMPALLLPQLLLCGIVTPRDAMPSALQTVSDLLPLSYTVDASKLLTLQQQVDAEVWLDLGVVAGFVVALLLLGAATLRRRTP